MLAVAETEPGPAETDNDGALQAWEIFSQIRLKAQLVALAACETGLGTEVTGEGLVGLTGLSGGGGAEHCGEPVERLRSQAAAARAGLAS